MVFPTEKLVRIIVPALLLGSGLTGCMPKFVEQNSSATGTQVDYAYIEPGADFSGYRKLMTDGLEIYFPENSESPTVADLQRIRDSFRTAFLTALGDDYPIVAVAGPDVLRVKAQVIDFNMTGRAKDDALPAVIPTGQLTFIMEMSDSMSNRLLARAADRSTNAAIDDDLTDWQAVDAAAVHWAGLFRNWLDRSLGVSIKD